MLDYSPLPVASAESSDASRLDTAPAGKAGGAASIEIFASFHALVDALSREADGATPAASRTSDGDDAGADAAAPAAGAKADDDTGSIVLPLDIAALLFSHTVLPQGPGGSTPHPTTAADDHGHHVWTAADLAALLRGERGGPAAAVAIAADGQGTSPAGDVAEFSVPDAALTPGVPADPAASTDRTARAAEATLAQAVAQRLAALASGPRPVTTDLAGRAGAPAQNLVDDLLRKIALTSERTPPAVMTTATRLVNSFATAVTPASAAQVLAGEVGAPAGLPLELPSPGTTDLIIQAIRLQWTKGGGEAQIRLEPRQFGDLTVSVSVNQGQVVARLQADTPIVREWLQANQQLLRQGLADQHLTLSRLEISEPSAESRHGAPRDGQSSRDGRGSSRDERSARRPRTPDTEETFDVVA